MNPSPWMVSQLPKEGRKLLGVGERGGFRTEQVHPGQMNYYSSKAIAPVPSPALNLPAALKYLPPDSTTPLLVVVFCRLLCTPLLSQKILLPGETLILSSFTCWTKTAVLTVVTKFMIVNLK